VRVDGRRIRRGNTWGKKGLNNRVWRGEIWNWPGLGLSPEMDSVLA
jgi:hypothetical protein